MTDCTNAEIRDMLPDYVNNTLSAIDAAVVESHIAACADCGEEVELLRTAVAVRPRAISIDVAKIVASLPKGQNAADPSVRAISSARSVSGKANKFSQWRGVAAAIAVIAIGGVSVQVARRSSTPHVVAVEQGQPIGLATSPQVVASVPESITVPVESASAARPTSSAKANALSVGELSDYSDGEIEAVMKRLERWDGATAADPLPGVPLLANSSGGVK
ncbi:MAG: zf-HC2 domain-containing protein [Gemmatimonadaceae bacterium]